MKRIALGLVLATSACNMVSPADQLENTIRADLSSRGNVIEVELTEQDNNRMTGHAVVRNPRGEQGRLDCTAERSGETSFNWRCIPAVDELAISQMETTIRQALAAQGTVEEVALERRDADGMTGFARVRGSDGIEVRTECTAARNSANPGTFDWRCAPGEAPAGDK